MITPKKIQLANIPTPLEEIKFAGKSFLIKRDDLTGCELSGNKIRKLEYLLADAKRQKADIIFTSGGDQSNHARATVIASRKIGLKTKLFLWGKDTSTPNGNFFLDKIYGADVQFFSEKEYENVNNIMFEQRMELLKKGKNAYVFPGGGSTTLGIWGYINFINELKEQVDLKKIDSIVAAAGSGGTAAGMLVGAALNKLKVKIVAVHVLMSKKEMEKHILQLAEGCILDYKLDCKINPDNLVVISGYSKEGYKKISEAKLKLLRKFALESGILLDPAYTGKAFTAYYEKYIKSGKGKKNIFVHTGGLFAVFARTKEYLNSVNL
ncbi:MAG: pyridoxal-phosphate dependent enzyme [Ignavibacteriota bacterium]|nr:pyridoxal-phosphate dependent enzyme [Ignavibacteriota bacterium]MCO6446695.1 pyridoxal-phosphate dependent enzyme [Ignavibacterium album]MCZ2268189.1 pyridoxal-phosphate dependent enzyme [Ignavibacteriales bacterium]HOJ08727.1 pyridoxal-phosphate dependent enzyme [Ignavibacteriaceae bacterium]MEB2355833.1 pyridoxal-phosphate dependent enzyme [Ignavibacteriales bacterium]